MEKYSIQEHIVFKYTTLVNYIFFYNSFNQNMIIKDYYHRPTRVSFSSPAKHHNMAGNLDLNLFLLLEKQTC